MGNYQGRMVKALERWAKPTAERYRQHVEACEHLGVEPDLFIAFVGEVLNTPKENRDWLLAVEPLQNYEPFVRFAQYTAPRVDELAGLSGRKR